MLPGDSAGKIPTMSRRIPVALAALLIAGLSNCDCAPPPLPAGEICGAGTVDGAPFALDPLRSRFIITVPRNNDNAACGVFHSHVVNATQVLGEFSTVSATPADSTMKITIGAAGLDPDAPELRKEFLPADENFPLSDGDRRSIRGSVAEEVKSNDFGTLVFTVSGISSTTGTGEATMTSEIAGLSSEVTMAYAVSKDGTAHLIKGTATLIGTPHGIPRNALGFCINTQMKVNFELALVPGAVTCGGIDDAPRFVPTLFVDDECAADVSYNEVREVAVRRCAGCHAEALRLGATMPLVEFNDWRTDSIRAQGRPLYATALEYIHLDPAEGLSMPPQPVGGELLTTDLTAAEIAIFDNWVEGGARNVKCADDPGPSNIGARIAPAACSDEFAVGDDTGSAQSFFNNNCAYCHTDATGFYQGIPQVAQLDGAGAVIVDPDTLGGAIDFDIGSSAVFHPFYVDDEGERASFWQTSLARIEDLSMPPASGGFAGDLDFAAFTAWVANGSPPPCQ